MRNQWQNLTFANVSRVAVNSDIGAQRCLPDVLGVTTLSVTFSVFTARGLAVLTASVDCIHTSAGSQRSVCQQSVFRQPYVFTDQSFVGERGVATFVNWTCVHVWLLLSRLSGEAYWINWIKLAALYSYLFAELYFLAAQCVSAGCNSPLRRLGWSVGHLHSCLTGSLRIIIIHHSSSIIVSYASRVAVQFYLRKKYIFLTPQFSNYKVNYL